ncbi:hypothetical protein AMEX_G26908 [Astyanax mexicanus]|uniref:Uncharacterized protein n=1 Tax=Astyanax mexicanus TaxID=7994 RepID=A0A8T2KMZ9_ASTMX|nr:hypothetical protein AMEX_G26908 [Astyanax mexicanus]
MKPHAGCLFPVLWRLGAFTPAYFNNKGSSTSSLSFSLSLSLFLSLFSCSGLQCENAVLGCRLGVEVCIGG